MLSEVIKYEKVHKVSNFNLRTYLTAIKGYAEILRNYKLGPLTSQQSEYTNFILDESEKVTQLLIAEAK